MKIKKWTESDRLEIIEGWARAGLSDGEIAKNMGISASSLSRALKQYPEIDKAIENGRLGSNVQVINALFQRALGYETIEYEIDEKGNKKAKRKKTIPGDVTAQIFWLKKRMPEVFGDKPEDNEEILERYRKLLKQIKGNIL